MSGRIGKLFGAVRRHPRKVAAWAVALLGLGVGAALGLRQLGAREHLRAAERALRRWHFGEAREHLRHCLRVWPGDAPTHLLAAQAARRAGFYREASQHLEACERLGLRGPPVALEGVLLRAQMGDLGSLEELLPLWVQQEHLDLPLALEAAAVGYNHVYDFHRAMYSLHLLLQRQPNNVYALTWRGRLLDGMNQFDKALEDFRKAVELDPDYDDARLLLAQGLSGRQRKAAEAMGHFERLLRTRPADPRVIVGLARCRRELGQAESAAALLDGLLAGTDDPEAQRERGQVALEASRPAEAERWLRRALAKEPADRTALFLLHRALEEQNKKEDARKVHAELTRLEADRKEMESILQKLGPNPTDLALFVQAGRLCLRNKQGPEAVRWLHGALRLNPNHREAHALLADCYRDLGNAASAAYHRRRAEQGDTPTTAQGKTP